jgi:hypothetical protein
MLCGLDCVKADARDINISSELVQSSLKGQNTLVEALNQAARRSHIVVLAVGNQWWWEAPLVFRYRRIDGPRCLLHNLTLIM